MSSAPPYKTECILHAIFCNALNNYGLRISNRGIINFSVAIIDLPNNF